MRLGFDERVDDLDSILWMRVEPAPARVRRAQDSG
jgi:hypothetical protein